MMPIWVYVVVAFVIAGASFVVAQIIPGAGMTFVTAASTIWVSYAIWRGRRRARLG